ncbi:MAG TPA: nicotinate-nucleotide--dimethylbenzimidazole phosphoribosyltransferase [Bacillota bacterium]
MAVVLRDNHGVPPWRAKSVPPLDEEARRHVEQRSRTLAKPPGSLGRLEALAADLAAMTGRVPPSCRRKAVVVMAADHGVVAEGVTAYPSDVTAWMVRTFVAGGAAVNVLAGQVGADVICVDVGVRGPDFADEPAEASSPAPPGNLGPVLDRAMGSLPGAAVPARLVRARVRPGTGNIAREPAMTRREAERAITVGARLAEELAADGIELLAGGEMGIGNTTASAAVVAALTGLEPEGLVGPGAGLGPGGIAHKREVVRRALACHRPNSDDPLGVLASVGGLEIGALAGLYIGAAQRRLPVVIDGVISTAAALLAEALVPGTRHYMIAGHRSSEPAHSVALKRLGLEPYLDLGMHLGEGTGALLAFSLIEAACRLIAQMDTLDRVAARAGVVHPDAVPSDPEAGGRP